MPEPDAGPVVGALVAAFVWLFRHPEVVYPLALGICVLFVLLCVAYLWFLQGARIIAAAWVWRRFFRWLRTRSDSPSGGRGGQSREYQAFMGSTTWRRQRARVLRRDRGRCRDCGGRAEDVHHETYWTPIESTPDYALTSLCAPCHGRQHGR
jgi:hypothetical protein